MSEYKKMVEEAVKSGAGEKVMWKAVAIADDLMEGLKESHPDEYKMYMRDMSEAINGCHYSEEMGKKDVEAMFHTDAQGKTHHGQHWSVDEIEAATTGKNFPSRTTRWDKYVAYNAAWHDFNKKFDDTQVLDLAYMFYFADEDFADGGKVWKYMSIV